MHLQRVPVPKSSVENTLRPELTSLAMLSHVMHLNMLARVPQSILAGADLSKGNPGSWKSHICALIFQHSQVLHSLQHAENCCLLYLYCLFVYCIFYCHKIHFFFLPLAHLPFRSNGADPSSSKLNTQGKCHVHPTWPFL